MNHLETIEKIQAYLPDNSVEIDFQQQTLALIAKYPQDFYKSTLEVGHLTGSVLIVSADYQQVLLTHHRKLNKWLQPGGHCEEQDESILATAWREAQEETGLKSLQLISASVFDLDIHPIPARGVMPEHLHYDIRFLFSADAQEIFQITEESNDLRWFDLNEVEKIIGNNESILRMIRKIGAN